MVGTYIAHTCPLDSRGPKYTRRRYTLSINSLGVEGREERVLEGVVGHRLAHTAGPSASCRPCGLNSTGSHISDG